MHSNPGLVGIVRNVNYEKLGEVERRLLDQEGSGAGSNSGSKSCSTTAPESSGRPPIRSDSLRGDARQVGGAASRLCLPNGPAERCQSHT